MESCYTRIPSPGTVVAAAIGVAHSKSVSTEQSNDLAVVHTHAIEDVTNVVLILKYERERKSAEICLPNVATNI
jgi:hypothetical protein